MGDRHPLQPGIGSGANATSTQSMSVMTVDIKPVSHSRPLSLPHQDASPQTISFHALSPGHSQPAIHQADANFKENRQDETRITEKQNGLIQGTGILESGRLTFGQPLQETAMPTSSPHNSINPSFTAKHNSFTTYRDNSSAVRKRTTKTRSIDVKSAEAIHQQVSLRLKKKEMQRKAPEVKGGRMEGVENDRHGKQAKSVGVRSGMDVGTRGVKHRKTDDKSSLAINAQDAMKVDEGGKPKAMTTDSTRKAPPKLTASNEKPVKPLAHGENSSHGAVKKEASRKVEKSKHTAKPSSQKTENKPQPTSMTPEMTAAFAKFEGMAIDDVEMD